MLNPTTNMNFQKIPYSYLSILSLFVLFSIASCEKDDPAKPTIDGAWEMKRITNAQNETITEELWGSVFWDFDVAAEEMEILVDYAIIIENNEGADSNPQGFFFGLTDGTYKLKVSSDNSKNEIQIGKVLKGGFILNGNELILKLDYDNGDFSSSEIYYFEK